MSRGEFTGPKDCLPCDRIFLSLEDGVLDLRWFKCFWRTLERDVTKLICNNFSCVVQIPFVSNMAIWCNCFHITKRQLQVIWTIGKRFTASDYWRGKALLDFLQSDHSSSLSIFIQQVEATVANFLCETFVTDVKTKCQDEISKSS